MEVPKVTWGIKTNTDTVDVACSVFCSWFKFCQSFRLWVEGEGFAPISQTRSARGWLSSHARTILIIGNNSEPLTPQSQGLQERGRMEMDVINLSERVRSRVKRARLWWGWAENEMRVMWSRIDWNHLGVWSKYHLCITHTIFFTHYVLWLS